MSKVLKADYGSGPADAYVEFTHSSVLTDFYFSVDVIVPSDTFAAVLADEWLGVIADLFQFSGSYFEGQYMAVNYFSDWSWDQRFGFYPGPEGITPNARHTVRWHYLDNGSTLSITWEVDGVNQGTVVGTTGVGIKRWRFGLLQGNDDVLVDNVLYLDNIMIGTSGFGSSEIFSDDFEDGTLAAWGATSGDVSVVDEPSFGPTEIPVTEITRDGVAPEAAVDSDASAGMYVAANDGRIFVEIESTDAGEQSVGFAIVETIDGCAIHDKTVVVPAGAIRKAGPFPELRYNQDDLRLLVNPSVDATLKLRAYQLKRDVVILDG